MGWQCGAARNYRKLSLNLFGSVCTFLILNRLNNINVFGNLFCNTLRSFRRGVNLFLLRFPGLLKVVILAGGVGFPLPTSMGPAEDYGGLAS